MPSNLENTGKDGLPVKFFKHLKTVTHHRHLVLCHCVKCGIPLQGLVHDLSKFSPAEFISGCKYYTGKRSPNEGERNAKGFSEAWMHHKGRNKHHFEYWNDISTVTHRYTYVKMPYRYLAEMLCDRVAASKTYMGREYTDDCALNYFLTGNGRTQMHPDTARELEKLLRMLANEGELKTFSYIKQQLKTKKNTPFDY